MAEPRDRHPSLSADPGALARVLERCRRHGNLARACREVVGAPDRRAYLLENRVRNHARTHEEFRRRLAAARAVGRGDGPCSTDSAN